MVQHVDDQNKVLHLSMIIMIAMLLLLMLVLVMMLTVVIMKTDNDGTILIILTTKAPTIFAMIKTCLLHVPMHKCTDFAELVQQG